MILKVSPMNCSIHVQVSSGALHIYGAALLLTGVRGVEGILTGAAGSAVTAPIPTVQSFTSTASKRGCRPLKCRIATISQLWGCAPSPFNLSACFFPVYLLAWRLQQKFVLRPLKASSVTGRSLSPFELCMTLLSWSLPYFDLSFALFL